MAKVHSVVGLITNSSTEIFSWVDESSIDNIKEIVNAILEHAGCEQTFDDFFAAEIRYKKYTQSKWNALEDSEKAKWDNSIHKWVKYYWDDEYPTENRVVVIDLYSGEELDWANKFAEIFWQDSIYNG